MKIARMNARSPSKSPVLPAGVAPSQEEVRNAASPAFLMRMADRLSGLKGALLQPKLRAAIYAAAVSLLTAGLILAIRALPEGVNLENPAYGLGVFLIIAPAIIAMNTVETEFTARVLGVRFGWRKALRIAVMSSAANVLPLPGGPMVRAAALKEKGVTLVRSSAFISAVTGFWLGFVFLYTGACLAALASGQTPLCGFFIAIGAVGVAMSVAWLRRLSCSWGQILAVGLLKIITTLIGVTGLWWTFALLGARPGFLDTSVFALSSASSLVITFVPAGIGVTESLSAGVAMLVSISPALAFLVSAIFRVLWLVFLLPLATLLLFFDRTSMSSQNVSGRNQRASVNKQTHAVTGQESRRQKAKKIELVLSRRVSIKSATILDVGAGDGEIANYFAQQAGAGGEVTGIDTVNQLCGDFPFQFKLANGTDIPCETGAVDIVISNHVIEHVGARNDQTHHLSEIGRVLKRTGVLYLAVPNRWTLVEPHYRLPFLSWLPKALADRYVAISKKEGGYDCALLSKADLVSLTSERFETEDATRETMRLYIQNEMSGAKAAIAAFLEKRFYRIFERFIPTLVFVCRPKAN